LNIVAAAWVAGADSEHVAALVHTAASAAFDVLGAADLTVMNIVVVNIVGTHRLVVNGSHIVAGTVVVVAAAAAAAAAAVAVVAVVAVAAVAAVAVAAVAVVVAVVLVVSSTGQVFSRGLDEQTPRHQHRDLQSLWQHRRAELRHETG
jgi:hypothetical protein